MYIQESARLDTAGALLYTGLLISCDARIYNPLSRPLCFIGPGHYVFTYLFTKLLRCHCTSKLAPGIVSTVPLLF